MTMTVPRPITGRGGRDQVPAMMDANDSIVSLCLVIALNCI